MKRVGGWIAVAGLLTAIGSFITCGAAERRAGTVYTAAQAAGFRVVTRAGLLLSGVGALLWLTGALRKKQTGSRAD